MTYADDVQTKKTPQNQPIRGKKQVQNRAGGYVFDVTDWQRLERFLILGHAGGTYYAAQRELSLEVVDCLDRCAAEDIQRTVQTIIDISDAGRAPKNDPAIFALAYLSSKHDYSGEAMRGIPLVCRTTDHITKFLNFSKTLGRGWGQRFKRGIQSWYDRFDSSLALARQVSKYPSRNGWSHADILRKCHYKVSNEARNNVLKYVTQHQQWAESDTVAYSDELLAAVDICKTAGCPASLAIELINEYGLCFEQLSTSLLNEPDVWDALLQPMQLTAMIRNLGKMSSIGILGPLSNNATLVMDRLTNPELLRDSRVHPMSLLIALKTYSQGRGEKGSLTWTPNKNIVTALDYAFYLAFDNIVPTGKKFLLGVDISPSMFSDYSRCVGTPQLFAGEAAAVMSLVAARTEKNAHICGFADQFRELDISPLSTLEDACRASKSASFGGTDCAVPIQYALNNNIPVDVFCLYTDNETWRGSEHVCQALDRYRQKTGIAAKLAVFTLAATNHSVADPTDSRQMNFVGMDTAAPALLADFAKQ